MDAFDFTNDDLLANRANKLTPNQHKQINSYIKIARISTRLALSACIGTVIVYFGIAYVLQPDNGFGQALPYLIFTAALFIGVFVFFIAVGIIQGRHLRERHISIIEGHASRSTRKLKHGRWTAYYVTIGNIRFQLSSQDQYEAFQDNVQYRVFYIQYPPAHLILAFEPIEL
ncbi:MAG: hypothetical protein H7Y59_18645 [Anaerolineales bacterium]|nr:hypothetical protein [Anaerolineales bacterium]